MTDKEFLDAVIHGECDVLAAGFNDKLQALAAKYSGDLAMNSKINEAVDAYIAKLDEISQKDH